MNSTLLHHCPPREISTKIRYIAEVVCFAGLTAPLCLAGVLTNLVNCVVFWRQGLGERMNLNLFALSLADLGYLLFVFAVVSVSSFIRFYDDALRAEYYSKSNVVLGGAVYAFKAISGCINMLIAVERCVCVLLPHRASTLMRTRTTGAILLSCILFFHGCFLMYPFSYRAALFATNGSLQWAIDSTRLYEENKVFMYTFENTILETAVPIVTFLIVSISTAVTVRALRASIRWRNKTSFASEDSHSRQMALTTMLVVVSCVYVITMAPFVARKLSFWFVGPYLPDPSCLDVFSAVTAAAFAASLVSSCGNFVVYVTRSSRYRGQLRRLVTCMTSLAPRAIASSRGAWSPA